MDLMSLLPDRFLMMTLKDIFQWVLFIGGVVIIIAEFVNKIPWQPLTKIFKWMGDRFNSDLMSKVDQLAMEQSKAASELASQRKSLLDIKNEIDQKFSEYEHQDAEKEAVRYRNNITVFSDSCRAKEKHSKSEFEKVFKEISDYDAHCKRYNLTNHQIDEEVRFIKEVYHDGMKENDFV